MNDKFKNKYRIPSARLINWDYRSNASYFITICTKYKQQYFGSIRNSKMHLSEIGQLAKKYWHEIPEHFSYVKLDKFIIMPNHIHGILIIDNPVCQTPADGVQMPSDV